MASLEHVNSGLPDEYQIDPAYVQAFAAKGFSATCLAHVVLDRLEARLRLLDRVRAGVAPPPPHASSALRAAVLHHSQKQDGVLIREWQDTWAENFLESPGFQVFKKPYEGTEEQKKQRKALADSD